MRRPVMWISVATFALLAGACGSGTPRSQGAPGVLLTFKLEAGTVRPDAATTERVAKMARARLHRLGSSGVVTTDDQAHTVTIRINRRRLDQGARHVLAAQANVELFDLESALLPPSIDRVGSPIAFRSRAALLRRLSTHRLPPRSVVITCSSRTATVCPGDDLGVPPNGAIDYYVFKHGRYPHNRYGPFPGMTGADIKLSGIRQDFDPTTGEPVVLIAFNAQGNKKFREITRNEAVRGRISRANQHFAMVIDDELRTWPSVDYRRFPNGIDPTNTGVQIAGLASLREARNLALVLQSGSLPVKLVLISERQVK